MKHKDKRCDGCQIYNCFFEENFYIHRCPCTDCLVKVVCKFGGDCPERGPAVLKVFRDWKKNKGREITNEKTNSL